MYPVPEIVENEKQKTIVVEMTDDEKVVLDLLNKKSPMDLSELKGQAGLSNKKWDLGKRAMWSQSIDWGFSCPCFITTLPGLDL